MKNYTIALDLGINNVGWTVFDLDTNKIEMHGVRLFNESSAALDRRNARSSRRVQKRRKHRVERIKIIFNKYDFYKDRTIEENLLILRVKALSEKITKQQLCNIIYYFSDHRGYIPFGDDDEIKIQDLGDMYPCNYLFEKFTKNGKYRADDDMRILFKDNIRELKSILFKQQSFFSEITNEFIEDLLVVISSKRKFWEGPGGNRIDQLSPFGRYKSINDLNKDPQTTMLFEELIGRCKVYIDEKVTSIANYYSEYFNFLNDFINMKISNVSILEDSSICDKYGKLTIQTIEKIKEYILNNKSISFKKIYTNILKVSIDNIEGYRIDKKKKPEISKFEYYKYCRNRFEGIDDSWINDLKIYNKLVYFMTVSPSLIELKNLVEKSKDISIKFSNEQWEQIEYIRSKKIHNLRYHSLSEKALIRAINDMKEYNMNFMQISSKLKYYTEADEYFVNNYHSTSKNSISSQYVDDLIASPQVKKTLRQAIRIINALIVKYHQNPSVVVIESTKEVNSKDRKKEIEKTQRLDEKYRNDAKKLIIDKYGEKYATNTNIEKVSYFIECNGHCIYCGLPIDLNDVIMGSHNVQIDHILPRSKSFDNSKNNKTLSCSSCNNSSNGKGNNTPYQYLNPLGKFEQYEKRVSGLKLSIPKIENLLYKGDIDRYTIRFFNRNLRDTAYATTALIEQIKLYSLFCKQKQGLVDDIKTLSVPGQITSRIRQKYDLIKDRDIRYHHAVDSSILSLVPNTDIGKVMIEAQNTSIFWKMNKNHLYKYADKLENINIDNYIGYIKEINYDNTKFSKQVDKSIQGKLSNALIKKVFIKNDLYYQINQVDNIYKYDFSKPESAEKFGKLFTEKSTNVLLCRENDVNLYTFLKDVFEQYKNEKGNPFINFAVDSFGLENVKMFDINKHGIRVPSKNGNGPIVKRLRYYSKVNKPYILVNKDNKYFNKNEKSIIMLDSLSQYCTRVYKNIDNGKFIFLPIYTISFDLKNKILNSNDHYYKKFYNDIIGKKNVELITDLFNGDYICVTKKDGTKYSGYVKGYHKTNKTMEFYIYNEFRVIKKFSSSDRSFELLYVDIIGNKFKKNLQLNKNIV